MSGPKSTWRSRKKKKKADPPPAGSVRGSCSVDIPAELASAIKEMGIDTGLFDEGIPVGAAVSSFMMMSVLAAFEDLAEPDGSP